MSDKKAAKYQRLYDQLSGLLTKTDDRVARMATIAAVLHNKMPTFFWTGFYQYADGQLLVGPYQGAVACQTLLKDTGVCWAAVNRNETVIVENVEEFPGHIACDSRSKSEVVVPCRDGDGNIFAVLDVDSDKVGSFDKVDGVWLEKVVELV
ncbi:MAG: GAF domain-containing protein [Phycisphaerae bacterium]|nr:GAF domain-containing protein [Phycisphaerae bacterium]